MDFKGLLVKGLRLVHELTEKPIEGTKKLEQLEGLCAEIIEEVDDGLLSFLPFGFGGIAKFVVDNPVADDLERRFLARPIAELIYQVYKALWMAGGLNSVNAALENMGGEAIIATGSPISAN